MAHRLVRGGQLTLHSARMFIQIMSSSLRIAVLVMSFCICIYLVANFNDLKMSQFVGYTLAWLFDYIGLGQRYINIENISMTAKAILRTKKYQIVFNAAIYGLFVSFVIGVITWIGLLVFFYRSGYYSFNKKSLRGYELVPAKILKKVIKKSNRKKNYQAYDIAGIPYTANGEVVHTIICGSTGSGKTVAISELVAQIKKRGDRAIVFDKMGTYVEKFYDEKKDIILNPFDKRSPRWSIFNEVKTAAHFDSIATAFIPTEKGTVDPFWKDAARTIFAEVCSSLLVTGGVTNQQLVKMLLKVTLKEVSKLVKETAAQAILDEDSPKTALSVMSMLSTYLKCFKYLKDEGDIFSIRDWVLNDKGGNCLFITSKGDLHSSLTPLISGWLEIAINNMLSLQQSTSRKIWVILDELPSLHFIPSLEQGLAETRQFGGCFVLGIQSIPQLRARFGRDTSESISALCGNKLFLRSPDQDTARWCSENLGHAEVEESKESFSYGEHAMRDGVNISKDRLLRPVVLAAEIMNLKNLEGYISLSNQSLISRIQLKYKAWPSKAIKFEEYMASTDSKASEKAKEDLANDYNADKKKYPAKVVKSESELPDQDQALYEV